MSLLLPQTKSLQHDYKCGGTGCLVFESVQTATRATSGTFLMSRRIDVAVESLVSGTYVAVLVPAQRAATPTSAF